MIAPTYAYTWPGPADLNTTTNDDTPRLIGKGRVVTQAVGEVFEAPVGAAITVDLRIGDRTTGVLDAAFATLTIPDGSLKSNPCTFSQFVAEDKFLAAQITQVGSGTAGKNMTVQVS